MAATAVETLSTHRCFGGYQSFHRHHSASTNTPMRYAVYSPPAAEAGPVGVVFCLAGLTCTEENFTVKAGAQRVAAEHGLMLVMPDTSPRGGDVPGDPDGAYDFGDGAGFYVDATEAPWNANYRMWSYVTDELPEVIAAQYASADLGRMGVLGHSMGGHGALIAALRRPERFRSLSAFAPIAAPSQVAWGRKALCRYLGGDADAWRAYDAVALIEDGARVGDMLVDQGEADPFLDQLRPDLLEAACARAGIALTLRRHEAYDHGYFFIASFIADHLRWHADRLR
ncbi:MAG: S-formylglutathione hydrolase [Sphingomonadaceae bacterium]|nr:S-formylglutathione hydrolase [Sphingomonadaceae bacterium]